MERRCFRVEVQVVESARQADARSGICVRLLCSTSF